MLTIRHTKTASGAQAVQVVTYRDRKVVVLKHIGSANSEEELALLDYEARVWISKYSQQSSIFPSALPLILYRALPEFLKQKEEQKDKTTYFVWEKVSWFFKKINSKKFKTPKVHNHRCFL